MTEQCKIYLDPWDKTDLEGTAMLIKRMPDIEEGTYRGVTCQRWFVRFLPDQDIVFRWLDYDDAEPYAYPHLATHVFTMGSPYIAITDASPTLSFLSAHSIELTWRAGNHVAAFQERQPSWLVGYSLVYTVFAATGGASLTSISLRAGDVALTSISMPNSTTIGGPYSQSWTWPSPFSIPGFSHLTAAFSGPQPAGESIALSNIIATMFIAWKT